MHIWSRNCVPSVDYNCQYQHTCHSQSLRDRPGRRCHCPEHRRHSKSDQQSKQKENEELGRLRIKSGKKVEDEIEADRYDELYRCVRNHTCQSFGEGVAKATKKVSISRTSNLHIDHKHGGGPLEARDQ
jgi:hypothetical protein